MHWNRSEPVPTFNTNLQRAGLNVGRDPPGRDVQGAWPKSTMEEGSWYAAICSHPPFWLFPDDHLKKGLYK